MARILSLVLMSVTILSLAGCGKTEEEKARENLDRHNQVAQEINAMGYPDSSWSDARLNALEAKLSELESLRSKLDGQDSVIIYGGNNSFTIARLRSAISFARAEKARQKIVDERSEANKTIVRDFNRLRSRLVELNYELQIFSQGSRPPSTLVRLIETTDKILGVLDEQAALLRNNRYAFEDSYKLELELRNTRTKTVEFKNTYRRELEIARLKAAAGE